MVASHFGTTIFSVAMVDDSMEISSEHGHNAGEEDIDIDIDLTSGQVDEDYMLEDVALNTGFDNSFNPQRSPLMGNDDVMIDDDDESYPMADAELIHDDAEQNMEQEVVTIPFPGPNGSHFAEDDGGATYLHPDSQTEGAPRMWDSHDVREPSVHETDVQVQKSEQAITQHDEVPLNDPEVKEAKELKEAPAELSDNQSQSTNLQNRSPLVATADQPGSPLAPIQEPGLGSPDRTSNHSDTGPHAEAAGGDLKHTIESTSPDDGTAVRSAPDVVVVYQSIEYGLFSTSDSDHPDSFFLSDLSLIEKSLVDFFKAIRKVIHEDLADDEDLCISVEDLGLEIDEVSSSTAPSTQLTLNLIIQTSPSILDVTFGEIITLYERLLQNEKVESPRPLRVLLATKSNFAKRLANLITGATEGKGLSELVNWGEHSESPLEPTETDEGKQREESALENYEADEDYGDASDRTNGEEVDATKAEPLAEPTSGHDQLSDLESVPKSNATASLSSANGTLVTQQMSASDAQTLSTTQAPTSGEYDEDDLIDYSDEELEDQNKQQRGGSHPTELETDAGRTHNGTFPDFIPLCLKPNTCFCSKCNDLLIAEYEAINEELRRRSISQAEDDDTENQAEGVEHGHELQPNPSQTKTGVDYDEDVNTGEGFDDSGENAEHEDPFADDGESYDAEADAEEQEDNHFDLGSYGAFEEEQLTSDSKRDPGAEVDTYGNENGNDAFGDEVEVGEEDANQTQSLPELGEVEAVPRKATSASSSLGLADAVESSATASADEIHHGEGVGKQINNDSGKSIESHTSNSSTDDARDEDEIDYEDDDDQDSLEAQDILQKSEDLPVKSGGPGKRPRAEDADLDEGMTTRSKGMHLRRSWRTRNR